MPSGRDFNVKICPVSPRGKPIMPMISQKIIIWRAPGPYGASPTQPYKCSQYFKVKTALVWDGVGAENFGLRRDKQVQPLLRLRGWF